MKPNKLPPREELLDNFTYDPELGNGSATTMDKKGYVVVRYNNLVYKWHRVAYKMYHGDFDESLQVDHIDGRRDNNKIENLRLVTNTENQRNAGMRKDNTSGRVGVHWGSRDKKWKAQICVDGKRMGLGTFASKAEAIYARECAERKYCFHQNGRRG